ncbi:hypothetical protein T484DRAFT_1848719 [Baffinella frigidus]|nr:hypothetical protein T484DRAFT_1848719 [Cryptophyta sp. CCMP2293]
MGAQEKDTVMATLMLSVAMLGGGNKFMLSVAMLGGGNKAVQDRFAEILGPASSQKFFIQLHQAAGP